MIDADRGLPRRTVTGVSRDDPQTADVGAAPPGQTSGACRLDGA